MTGLVTDFVALGNYCQVCETGSKADDDGYNEWLNNHQAKCQKNITRWSAASEMQGAVIMFKRPIELHGFRYTEMPGDGDAKTHSRLLQDPCDGRPIEKLECVDHVTKRMRTALRNLVEKGKAQGQPTGGRGNYNTGSQLWTQNGQQLVLGF